MKNIIFFIFCACVFIILIDAQEKYARRHQKPAWGLVQAQAKRPYEHVDIGLAYRNLGAFVQRYCTKRQYDLIQQAFDAGEIKAEDVRGCFIGAALSK